jgi:putative permease
MYYLISEKEYIFMSIAKVFPEKGRVHVIELGKRTDEVIRKFFKGQGMMIGIIFIYFAITLSLLSLTMSRFDISHALIFALLMGMLNIIPYLGAWIGLSAPLIFLLTIHLDLQSQLLGSNLYIYGMIGVIVIFFIEQLLEMSIIQPTVLGKQVHIHPLLVLSRLIFFGGLFGFVGVLLAVPLSATLKVVFEYIKEVNTPGKSKSKVKKEKEVAELNVVDSVKE